MSLSDVYEVKGDLSKNSSKSKLEVRMGGFVAGGGSLLGVTADMELWRRISGDGDSNGGLVVEVTALVVKSYMVFDSRGIDGVVARNAQLERNAKKVRKICVLYNIKIIE